MKTIITIAAVIAMSITSFAQTTHAPKHKEPKAKKLCFDPKTATPTQIAAHELKVSNNTYFIGLGFAVTGAAVSIWDFPQKRLYYTCGLLTSALGGILMIESHAHIGRAGRALNGQKVYYTAGFNGLGIMYRF